MSKSKPEASRVAILLQKLCLHISGRRKEGTTRLLKIAVNILTTEPVASAKVQDEFFITEHIKKKLSQIRSEKDVYTFIDLHRKLQGLPMKKRQAVLLFLMCMSEKLPVSNSSSSQSVSSDLIASSSSDSSSSVSQKASLQDAALFDVPKLLPSSHTSTPESSFQIPMRTSHSSDSWHHGNRENFIRRTPGSQTMISPLSSDVCVARQTTISQFGTEISESQLLQELIYAFEGIDGKYLKLCPRTQGYKLDPKVRLKCSVRQYVLRVAELGWLHNQVRQICENASLNKPQGLIASSLIAALREELTEHYRLVAVLQAQIRQQLDMLVDSPLSEEQPQSRHEGLTLRRLAVWTMEPQARMKCLVAVAKACKDRKGGALASCVHGFLQHGDPVIRDTVKFLLGSVCRPMYVMLSHWILDGELEDPYGEFFIAANLDVKGDRLWHDKYCVLESMVPSFISLAQARKILATGKSINFLREVCRDHTPLKGRDLLKRTLESTSVEALFMTDKNRDLHAMMDSAYLETSRRVLDVLTGQYKFLDHLQALRRYLLLGQGDFIRHLMELLEPELLKPSNQLYPHNLSGILESAVRATNAQFEDSDILKRLDVQLFEHSGGETGWDVFALTYHVAGPIGTIFSNDTISYLTLFFALWKAKRMEWILSQMWKKQMTSSKWLRKLPELRPVLQQVYLLTSEMVHFIHQMQYYILFEVLECSWDVLIKKVHQAESLDDIIAAHEHFLQTVKAGALLDANSQELAGHLDQIYKFILQLQELEGKLHDRALSELELRTQQERVIEERAEFGEFGITEEEEKLQSQQIRDFQLKFIPSVAIKLKSTSDAYQDTVKKFLLSLASQTDVSLQLLSFRLDFNEHYKRLDSRLTVPLTYQHRRLSEMGLGRGSPSAMSQARVRGK